MSDNWLKKVSFAQSTQNSEKKAEILRRASENQRHVSAKNQSSKISKRLMMVSSAWAMGNNMSSEAERMNSGNNNGNGSASHNQLQLQAQQQTKRMTSLNSAILKSATTPMSSKIKEKEEKHRTVAADEDEEDLYDSASDISDEEERQQYRQVTIDLAAAETDKFDIQKLLSDLRHEPEDDEGRKTKFLLYEELGKAVENSRNATFQFWNENNQLFPPNPRQTHERKIARLDKDENFLGFADNANEWFVCSMSRVAHSNLKTIDNLLRDIRRQMEMLAKQSECECPVCLELPSGDNKMETLGCCHRVCSNCWNEWKKIKKNCPVCRHEDFLNEIFTRTAATTTGHVIHEEDEDED